MKKFSQVLVVIGVSVLLGSYHAPAAAAAPGSLYFPETGHSLKGTFLSYWQQYGGLAQFGYPLTEEASESGYTVQYFERARFELHPENPAPNDVLLGLLGRIVTKGREGEQPFLRTPPMMNPVTQYFDQTGHNLSPPFLGYWQQHGGLPIYGYPISEPFKEVSKTDGKSYLVQYFERTRFELHPELPDPYKVSLGMLGREVLAQREAIKVVKQASYQLPSHPHIYNVDSGNYVRLWPDGPGSVVTSYSVCGAAPLPPPSGGVSNTCEQPMTLTTEVATNSQGSGLDVVFTATWAGTTSTINRHGWRYHVSDNNRVDFIREDGDRLPVLPV
jgi:hypothetical protein